MRRTVLALIACSFSIAASASPVGSPLTERVASGSYGGATWEARSLIVGQTNTLFPNPDPVYLPNRPQKDGLGFMEVNFGGAGTGYCSGSLMADGRHIITAAHCIANNAGALAATGGNVYFYNGPADPFYDLGFGITPGIQRVAIADFFIAPGYTGSVIDHADVAILRLAEDAPDFATRYLLGDRSDLAGQVFNVAGFGNMGASGASGASGGTFGRLREGDNQFEFRLGDAAFGNSWSTLLGDPMSQIEDVWLSDFDRVGFAANDTACLVTGGLLGTGVTFCDTGVGPREVGVAGGDSGGPQFLDGEIVAVTSFGLTFGGAYGDFGGGLNSGWGEFSGYAPLYRFRDWIEGIVPGAFSSANGVPVPATLALTIVGLMLMGVRRQRRTGA